MKKLLRKHSFTLVEVLIAMGICVIGICSLMVFFPIGANASRDAAMASYASNTADQLLSFAKVMIEADNGKNSCYAMQYFTGWNQPCHPGDAGTPYEPGPDYYTTNAVSNFQNNMASSFNKKMQETMKIMLENDCTKVTPCDNNVYYFEFTTKDGSGEMLSDFNCYASLYATPVYVDEEDATKGKVPFAARLHVQISWPAELPFENRQTRDYSLDVFKAY